MSRLRLRAVACAVLVWGLACPALRAKDEPADGDPAAFEKGLKKVESLYERDRGEAGLKALKELLEEHARRPYARARRAEIADLARRLAFRAQAVVPDPETLVSGKLKKWDARSGKIQIEYAPDTAGDLEKSEGGTLYFPMGLCGPTTLEIEGPSYPMTTDDSPTVYLTGERNEKRDVEESYMVVFGTPPYAEGSSEVWMPARILRYDGDQRVTLCEKEICPAKRGEPFELKLKISNTSLQASVNKRPLGKAKKGKDVWGYLGFECKGWSKVTFSGEVEPSWIQSKIDEALSEQREAFDKTYDRSQVLPDWLFEAVPEAAAPAAEEEADLPEALAEVHWPRLQQVYDALEAEDYAGMEQHIAKMRSDGAPESVCAYLEAVAKDGLGLSKDALARIDRCLELAPKFVYGLLLRASLLWQLNRPAESGESFQAAVELSPATVQVYEMGALTMLLAGDLERAQTFARKAAERGLVSPRLTLLNSAIVKAEKGPNWARTFEHRSANYHVVSDIDKKTCIEASKILEDAFVAYRVNFGWVSRDRSRLFKVYLFSGQTGFVKYQEDVQQLMGRPAEQAAGLYMPLLKQLLIWNLPSREEMYATIRHEGFHQYMDRFLGEPPTWFNEGLAVYHEDAEMRAGSLVFGQVQREYVDLLEEKGLLPLEEFLFQPGGKFYEAGARAYAQAWAFVHMLRHGTTEQKALFEKLVEGLEAGDPPMEVVRGVFPKAVLESLDDALGAYVEDLGG